MFKKSTRDIVSGKRAVGAVSPQPDGTNTPGNPGIPAIKNLPKWAPWAACAAAIVLIVGIVLTIISKDESKTVPPVVDLPKIQSGQTVVSVHADIALAALASPGDIVQLSDASGKEIALLRYVQVYRTDNNGYLLLLVNANQAAAITSNELSPTVILICHNNPQQAAKLLELQKQLENPIITLTVQESITVALGETVQLEWSVSISPEEAILPPVTWHTSEIVVASVAQDGTIKGWNPGEVTITATCGDATATCVVTVSPRTESVTISAKQLSLAAGQKHKLTASPHPYIGTFGKPIWESDNHSVATVSEDGTVTGQAAGKATITVTIDGVCATCTVTVGAQIESVSLEPTSITLRVGQVLKLKTNIYPSNAVGELLYGSSNKNVVTVDENGVISALAPGKATIYLITSTDIADCTVTVAG